MSRTQSCQVVTDISDWITATYAVNQPHNSLAHVGSHFDAKLLFLTADQFSHRPVIELAYENII